MKVYAICVDFPFENYGPPIGIYASKEAADEAAKKTLAGIYDHVAVLEVDSFGLVAESQ